MYFILISKKVFTKQTSTDHTHNTKELKNKKYYTASNAKLRKHQNKTKSLSSGLAGHEPNCGLKPKASLLFNKFLTVTKQLNHDLISLKL